MVAVPPAGSPRHCWTVVAVLCVGIAVASLVETGGTSAPPPGPLGVVGVDKYQHAAGYAVLGAAVAGALAATGHRRVSDAPDGRGHTAVAVGIRVLPVAFVATVGYGVVLEALQVVVATRHPSVADAAADAVGAVLGVACWCLLVRAGVVGDGGVNSSGSDE